MMGGNVLDITLQDVAEGVDRVHVDALIVLQAVDQRFTDMMFFMYGIFRDPFFLHVLPYIVISYQ